MDFFANKLAGNDAPAASYDFVTKQKAMKVRLLKTTKMKVRLLKTTKREGLDSKQKHGGPIDKINKMKGERVEHLAKGERRNFRKASFTLGVVFKHHHNCIDKYDLERFRP